MTWNPQEDPSHFKLGAINALGFMLRPDGGDEDVRRMLARFDDDQLRQVEDAASALALSVRKMRGEHLDAASAPTLHLPGDDDA